MCPRFEAWLDDTFSVAMATLFGSVNTHSGRKDADADNPGAVVIEIDGRTVTEAPDLDKRFQVGHGRAFINFVQVTGRTVRLRFPWNPQVSGIEKDRRQPRLADVEIGGSATDSFPKAVRETARWNAVDALTSQTIASGTAPMSVESAGRSTASFQFRTPELSSRKDMRPVRVDVAVEGRTDSIPIMVIDPEQFFRPRTERLTEYYAAKGVRQSFPIGTGTREILRNPPSVAQPDDQVWCYARHLQDGGEHSARRAFAGNQGMDFAPRGWMEFNNGEPFFDLSVPHLVERGVEYARRTGKKKMAIMLSDHWHAAPQLNQSWAWQHIVAFDRHLRSGGKPGLTV